jgi:hypothetical protein
VLNLSFSAETAHMQLSSDLGGITLGFGLKLQPKSPAFRLASGLKLHECIFALTVYPVSESPYAEKFKDDGRVGEFRTFTVPLTARPKENNLYMLWVHISDGQWNLLYAQTAKGKLSIDFVIGVDDDDDAKDGLRGGEYRDILPAGNHLALRSFLFTMPLSAAKEQSKSWRSRFKYR